MDFNNGTTFNENVSSQSFRRVHQPYDHQHWDYFFERGDLPAPAWMHYATGSYILLVSLTGSIGNALLLWAFSWPANETHKVAIPSGAHYQPTTMEIAPTLRSPSNLLIANLAVADLGLSLFTFPLITISSYQKQWVFGKTGCDYYVVTAGLFGLGSISTMASISVDRWCSITKWSQWHLTYRRAYIWMMAIWLYSFAMIGPPLLGWSRYVIEGFQTSCTFDWLTHDTSSVAFVWYLIILGFLLPLFVIFLCYSQIISHLVRHRTIMSKAGFSLRPSEAGRKFVRTSDSGVPFEPVRPRANSTMGALGAGNRKPKLAGLDSDTRAAVTCAIIVALFVLAWGPYAVVAVVGVVGDQSLITPVLNALPVLFAKSSAVYNPIVYALMNEKFRAAIVSLLNCDRTSPTPTPGANRDRSRSKSRSLSLSGSDNGRRLAGLGGTLRTPLTLELEEELQEFRERVNTGASSVLTPVSQKSGLSTISETPLLLQQIPGKKEEQYRRRLHTIDTISERRRAQPKRGRTSSESWAMLENDRIYHSDSAPSYIPPLY